MRYAEIIAELGRDGRVGFEAASEAPGAAGKPGKCICRKRTATRPARLAPLTSDLTTDKITAIQGGQGRNAGGIRPRRRGAASRRRFGSDGQYRFKPVRHMRLEVASPRRCRVMVECRCGWASAANKPRFNTICSICPAVSGVRRNSPAAATCICQAGVSATRSKSAASCRCFSMRAPSAPLPPAQLKASNWQRKRGALLSLLLNHRQRFPAGIARRKVPGQQVRIGRNGAQNIIEVADPPPAIRPTNCNKAICRRRISWERMSVTSLTNTRRTGRRLGTEAQGVQGAVIKTVPFQFRGEWSNPAGKLNPPGSGNERLPSSASVSNPGFARAAVPPAPDCNQ